MAQRLNILITGCNGFIGKHLAAALAYHPDIKCDITGVDPNEITDWTPSPILDQFHKCDTGSYMKLLNDGHQLKNLFPEKVKYDFIIHLGTISRSAIYDEYPEDSVSSDTLALLSILAYCRFHKDTKLIYLSNANAGISASPFNTSKLNAECLITSYVQRYHIRAAVIKVDKVFGPGENDYVEYNSLMRACKNAILSGTVPTMYGDGTQTHDWIHVTKVTEGIISVMNDHMLSTSMTAMQSFNIFSGIRRSVEQIIEAFGFKDVPVDRGKYVFPFKQPSKAWVMSLPVFLRRQHEMGIPQIDVLEYIEAWLADNKPD